MPKEAPTERPMYVLIADIVKSSSFSEVLDNQTWEKVRREFSKIIGNCISRASKCYKEYSKPKEGDTGIAFFMACENVIDIALQIRNRWTNSNYNLQRQKEGKPDLLVAIAIHYGILTLSVEGPQGYIINLTSKLQKRASELAREEGKSIILATKDIMKDLNQESKIARRIEAFPLGKTKFKDLNNMPEVWEIKERSEAKGKLPTSPQKTTKDEKLVQQYLEKGHPLRIILQVIDVDILPSGSSFVTDTRIIKKVQKTSKDEDELHFGVYDSPDCRRLFTEEVFSLQIKDGDGNNLKVKWNDHKGTIKRFGTYLGRTMIENESMFVRASMFIPQLFDMDAEEEYFDLDIWDPTDKASVKLWFPADVAIGRNIRFEYENGQPCPGPQLLVKKRDPIEKRLVISYVYEKPRVATTYYFRWTWPKRKKGM
jgi:class 3 adenylate cyclase